MAAKVHKTRTERFSSGIFSLLFFALIFIGVPSLALAAAYGASGYGAGLYGTGGDVTSPIISTVSAGSPGVTSTLITWITDEVSDSQVQYGATNAYGASTTLDTGMTTSHSVAVTGLSANTLYHYQVRSTDASGNLATSSDYTFTTAAAATVSSGGGGGGSSGGGGGGGAVGSISSLIGTLTSSAATSTTTNNIAANGGAAATTTAVQTTAAIPTCLAETTTSTTSVDTTSYAFTRELTVGAKGADVLALQEYLNTHGFVIAASGPGSPGNESTYFGKATQAALAKWQKAQGITPAAGYFGAKTRGMLK